MKTSRQKHGALACASMVVIGGALALAAPPPKSDNTGDRPEPQVRTEAVSREEAIASSLAAIEKELAAHGGSWEAWGKELAPYRDDIRDFIEDWRNYKWPWPAKRDHQYQGAVISVHLRETFDDLPDGHRPFDGILHLDRQLKSLGIDMIVAIIPAKLSIYPDYLYAAVKGEKRPVRTPKDLMVALATRHLLYRLLKSDVEVVDLYKAYADFRRKHGDDPELFLKHDAHYNNLGARVAAAAIAERLMRYDFVQAGVANNPYVGVPGARHDGRKADSNLLIIKDKQGRLYRDAPDSPVLLVGDSHMGYNSHLGAFASAQIAHYAGLPLSQIWKEGLCAEAPVRLVGDRHLAKRKVVILNYGERMLNPGRSPGKRWPLVDLPGAKAATKQSRPAGPDLTRLPAAAVIEQVSNRPDLKAPYAHFIMKFYVRNLSSFLGKVGTGDGVLRVLAMHNRKVLPIAKAKKGDKLKVKLTSWRLVEKKYGSIQSGSLDDVKLELEKALYWAEIDGAPELTAEELKRVGEEADR